MDVAEAADLTAAMLYCVIPLWYLSMPAARFAHGVGMVADAVPTYICPEPVAYIDGLTMTTTWN